MLSSMITLFWYNNNIIYLHQNAKEAPEENLDKSGDSDKATAADKVTTTTGIIAECGTQ